MTASSPSLLQRLKRLSLVTQIIIGLIAGIALALFAPEAAKARRLSARCSSRR
jgi:serine/threonine transporter